MAGEEDVELRDLVAQSLEAKGVLGKIRAQLRANVFLALEEQESQEKPHPFVSEKLQDFRKTKEGRQAVAVVREFLEFFQLDFTTAVFDPETNACESYPGREQLARDLGVEPHSDSPLLSSLLTRPHSGSPSHSFHPSLHSPSHPLPPHAASFPTPLSHHTSHHHITNGNAIPPLTSDSAHSKSHQHYVSSTGNVTTPTSAITTVTSSITTTTAGGKDPPTSTTSMSKSREKEVVPSLPGSTHTSGKQDKGTGERLGTQRELDDFFGTLTPLSSLPPPPPMTHPSRVESDSSISELEDSMASGKTTDVTQTEQSLHGDYDYLTDVVPQEQ